ncbi:hypothetical protein [Deminuibacter soli]|uniref:hypothetical protein n=1 Tax=Deminuibacter soli TaxID=2291815 RepID=UPI0013149776|nr:hypothetical protein [Deminuibacter soli]
MKDLQPTVYRDGATICILEGGDPETGDFGCGSTMEEAMAAFQDSYEKSKENSL